MELRKMLMAPGDNGLFWGSKYPYVLSNLYFWVKKCTSNNGKIKNDVIPHSINEWNKHASLNYSSSRNPSHHLIILHIDKRSLHHYTIPFILSSPKARVIRSNVFIVIQKKNKLLKFTTHFSLRIWNRLYDFFSVQK